MKLSSLVDFCDWNCWSGSCETVAVCKVIAVCLSDILCCEEVWWWLETEDMNSLSLDCWSESQNKAVFYEKVAVCSLNCLWSWEVWDRSELKDLNFLHLNCENFHHDNAAVCNEVTVYENNSSDWSEAVVFLSVTVSLSDTLAVKFSSLARATCSSFSLIRVSSVIRSRSRSLFFMFFCSASNFLHHFTDSNSLFRSAASACFIIMRSEIVSDSSFVCLQLHISYAWLKVHSFAVLVTETASTSWAIMLRAF